LDQGTGAYVEHGYPDAGDWGPFSDRNNIGPNNFTVLTDPEGLILACLDASGSEPGLESEDPLSYLMVASALLDLLKVGGRRVLQRDDPVGFSAFANVSNWLAGTGFSQSNIELRLPRFLIRRTADLLPALDEVGLGRARRDPNAFVRLTRKPVDISAIIQKVYLKVDEQGSEAAAATAIVDRSITAKPSVANSVTFDKPFIFALRDQVTGLFLRSGYVGSLLAETVAASCASARDCPQK
jgi:hypothetical protein